MPVNFSDIGDPTRARARARPCLFFLFCVRAAAPRRAAPSFIRSRNFRSVYIRINSHTRPHDTPSPPRRVTFIHRLIDPLYQSLPNRDISHDQSPGNFRCQAPRPFPSIAFFFPPGFCYFYFATVISARAAIGEQNAVRRTTALHYNQYDTIAYINQHIARRYVRQSVFIAAYVRVAPSRLLPG